MLHDVGLFTATATSRAEAMKNNAANTFTAKPLLFENTQGYEIDAEFNVINVTDATIEEGMNLLVAKTIQGAIVPIISTVPTGGTIEFEIVEDTYGYGYDATGYEGYETDNLCGNMPTSTAVGAIGKIIRRPCGASSVFGETNGFVPLVDSVAGQFLAERKPEDIIGKTGFATLMSAEETAYGEAEYGESGYGETTCQWVITWINWFTPQQTVQDVIEKADEITIELENRWVWNHCRLDDEHIYLIDCEEEEEEEYGYGYLYDGAVV